MNTKYDEGCKIAKNEFRSGKGSKLDYMFPYVSEEGCNIFHVTKSLGYSYFLSSTAHISH
jgi:hypothetical protein